MEDGGAGLDGERAGWRGQGLDRERSREYQKGHAQHLPKLRPDSPGKRHGIGFQAVSGFKM